MVGERIKQETDVSLKLQAAIDEGLRVSITVGEAELLLMMLEERKLAQAYMDLIHNHYGVDDVELLLADMRSGREARTGKADPAH